METKARISDISKDFRTGKTRILFTCDHVSPEEIERLSDKDIRLRAVQWRRKRSLDSNAYFWLLATRLAEVRGTTLTYMHNWLISEYGQVDMDIKTIIMDDEIEWTEVTAMHLRPTPATRVLDNGKLYRVYYVMRGSHTYDTKEMSRLIEGTIQDCKAEGIETLPPEEIERMMSAWQPKVS